MLSDKWRFDTHKDLKILKDNFDSVSLNIISNTILQAVSFQFSLFGYIKKMALQFIDVIDKPNLIIELIKSGQLIIDPENKRMRK